MKHAENEKPALTLWIIWGALFFSLLVYLLVLYITITQGKVEAKDPEFVSTIRVVFAVVAVAEAAVIFVLRNVTFFNKLRNGDITSLTELRGKYLTTSMVSWALSESIAIYGFVLSFLTLNLVYYFAFLAPAVALFIVFRPQLGRYEEEFSDAQPTADDTSGNPGADEELPPGSW